ncbi:SKP1-like protein 1A [Canna indica]|uniref:SKP1-like protein n=1 Tax=Canna indica TaxID=4628 RepID=A0AAQ3K435_9LILI|nr:SKP1-like protein 1A [Canna indica]
MASNCNESNKETMAEQTTNERPHDGDEGAKKIKKVTLQSKDGDLFEVDEAVALQSRTIKLIIEDCGVEAPIPVPNVTSVILAKVLEYLQKHTAKNENSACELRKWDAEYAENLDHDTLFDLLHASNYLNITSLMEMLCKTVADMMKGKTPDEIRKQFHIVNDYTPDEEEEVKRENSWAFE